MSIPYSTATAGGRALDELQKTLAKFGCQSFGTMTDTENGKTIVQFKWRNRQISLEASWNGYAAAWLKENHWNYRKRWTRAEHDRRALEQAKISVCSVLRDWVKGQVTAIECGVMSFDAAFMPHMLLPSGERVIDYLNTSNLLPAPEQNKVVELKR
jgi:hypothetical protein